MVATPASVPSLTTPFSTYATASLLDSYATAEAAASGLTVRVGAKKLPPPIQQKLLILTKITPLLHEYHLLSTLSTLFQLIVYLFD